MKQRSVTSPDDQNVTFVELFFDLVFVFSVTQVVSLLHDDLSWTIIGQSIIVFWLVWWAWTQFTWALNAADTTHTLIQLSVLCATAVAFFMAVALPGAFEDQGLWFAIAYILVRGIGLLVYAWVSRENSEHIAAVRLFSTVSVGGLASVLVGGIIGGEAQFGLWGLAILLDVIAAGVGGRADGWNLHPEHFAERHGLFVIIALGETLIVAASGASSVPWSFDLAVAASLSVAVTCSFWWSYFPKAKPILDEALASATEDAVAPMARTVFSLLHFPMLCGIVAYALAIEQAVSHPTDPFTFQIRAALASGIFLFVGGMIPAMLRAGGKFLVSRLLLILFTSGAVVLMDNFSPLASLLVAFAGVVIIVFAEHRSLPTPA